MRRRHRTAVLLAAAALLVLGCGREPVARNVILISLDTLRADHLGSYGYAADTSPALDAFASTGVLFENAWTTAPWTLPAHTSLLTGLYPTRHGVRYEEHSLDAAIPSASEILKRAGFRTGAVVNNLFLYGRFGLARGYDRHDKIPEDHGAQGAARRVSDSALAFLEASRGERVFLFVHYFDVHSDYRSAPRVEAAFGGRPTWVDGTTKQLTQVILGRRRFEDEREIAALTGLYDAGIRQLDGELARFFSALEAGGWLDSSVVVVTSDHGEELLDHGGVMHGATQYEEQLRVPLLLRGPGVPTGARVAAPVSLVDVLPTILDLAGVEAPPGLDGRSLRGTWSSGAHSEPGSERTIFAEANRAPKVGSRVAVRRGPHKLLLDLESGERRLYDLERDPGESHDRIAEDPERAETLLSAFEDFRASRVEDSWVGEVPDDMRERLRALGYEESSPPLSIDDALKEP